MRSDRSLFDRLRHPEPEDRRSIQQQTRQVADSVLAHLRRLLNTRHGDSAAMPEFGIPALEAAHITTSAMMQREIERAIREFEPRLDAVRVRLLPRDPYEPLRVRFEISARLATAKENVRVTFSSHIDARGGWKVSG